jgi:hypothetical protein
MARLICMWLGSLNTCYFLIWCLMLAQVVSIVFSTFTSTHLSKIDNFFIHEDGRREATARTATHCASMCAGDASCSSLFYNSRNGSCVLAPTVYSADVVDQADDQGVGWTYWTLGKLKLSCLRKCRKYSFFK